MYSTVGEGVYESFVVRFSLKPDVSRSSLKADR